jgi:peptidoglycan/LPS O-acetylase OafA/YrhL
MHTRRAVIAWAGGLFSILVALAGFATSSKWLYGVALALALLAAAIYVLAGLPDVWAWMREQLIDPWRTRSRKPIPAITDRWNTPPTGSTLRL